ncbi:hypothetical protein RN001_011114 [Aquatica leii]|uniref:C2H2-type domain-containing protein n=1 Tax=Aquatica leii TaxID=1421715 RepID=A0AAN7SNL8_9COLE|nr:hypothetical protein RN001_011114 [Aquatica leii]
MRKHTGEKPFQCSICDYSSRESGCLKIHMYKHTGEKPFKCNICDYCSITVSHLKMHMRKHTGEKPFQCNICDYSSSQSKDLKIHMRKHTGEKPFKCSICDYGSTTKSNLKTHMRKHTGEKPFKCNICDYCSTTKLGLERHMRTHTGEKPFECNICNYSCSQSGYLKIHMQICQKGKTSDSRRLQEVYSTEHEHLIEETLNKKNQKLVSDQSDKEFSKEFQEIHSRIDGVTSALTQLITENGEAVRLNEKTKEASEADIIKPLREWLVRAKFRRVQSKRIILQGREKYCFEKGKQNGHSTKDCVIPVNELICFKYKKPGQYAGDNEMVSKIDDCGSTNSIDKFLRLVRVNRLNVTLQIDPGSSVIE